MVMVSVVGPVDSCALFSCESYRSKLSGLSSKWDWAEKLTNTPKKKNTTLSQGRGHGAEVCSVVCFQSQGYRKASRGAQKLAVLDCLLNGVEVGSRFPDLSTDVR